MTAQEARLAINRDIEAFLGKLIGGEAIVTSEPQFDFDWAFPDKLSSISITIEALLLEPTEGFMQTLSSILHVSSCKPLTRGHLVRARIPGTFAADLYARYKEKPIARA
jgi:hypothetical protein